MDIGKHLMVFSVADPGEPSEGELWANPSTVGLVRGRCALAVGFVTGLIGGTELLRAEAVLFAKMVKMETTSGAGAPVSGRFPSRCGHTWKAFVEVAKSYSTYKPVAVDEKSHLLSLTLGGRSFVGWVDALKNERCRLTVRSAAGPETARPPEEGSVRKLTERVKLQERFDRLSRNQ
jgi:hypothetical protein